MKKHEIHDPEKFIDQNEFENLPKEERHKIRFALGNESAFIATELDNFIFEIYAKRLIKLFLIVGLLLFAGVNSTLMAILLSIIQTISLVINSKKDSQLHKDAFWFVWIDKSKRKYTLKIRDREKYMTHTKK